MTPSPRAHLRRTTPGPETSPAHSHRATRLDSLLPLLLAAPVVVGIAYAALASVGLAGTGARGLTATHWVRALGDAAIWRGLGWSLWIAAASTAISTGIAVILAVAFRGRARSDRLARLLAIAPLPIPHLVAGVCGVLILGQSGVLARIGYALGWVSMPSDMPALVADPLGIGLMVSLIWKEVPFLALVAFSVLASRGTQLEEAARTLGASPAATFRWVTWPVLWRGMMPAIVAVFAFVVGSWELPSLLAPSDPLALPLQILERHTDPALARRGEAFVLTALALGLALAVVILHERLRARWSLFAR
jgi:putative spermidine/putrescine transport system permease protein